MLFGQKMPHSISPNTSTLFTALSVILMMPALYSLRKPIWRSTKHCCHCPRLNGTVAATAGNLLPPPNLMHRHCQQLTVTTDATACRSRPTSNATACGRYFLLLLGVHCHHHRYCRELTATATAAAATDHATAGSQMQPSTLLPGAKRHHHRCCQERTATITATDWSSLPPSPLLPGTHWHHRYCREVDATIAAGAWNSMSPSPLPPGTRSHHRHYCREFAATIAAAAGSSQPPPPRLPGTHCHHRRCCWESITQA